MFMKKHSVAILVIACLAFTTLGLLLLPKTATQPTSGSEKSEQGVAGQLGEKWFLEDFDPIMELKNDVYLTTFYSGNADYERIKELFHFIDENKVVVKPNKVFKLSEIKEAHEYLDSKNGIGKVVCVV